MIDGMVRDRSNHKCRQSINLHLNHRLCDCLPNVTSTEPAAMIDVVWRTACRKVTPDCTSTLRWPRNGGTAILLSLISVAAKSVTPVEVGRATVIELVCYD